MVKVPNGWHLLAPKRVPVYPNWVPGARCHPKGVAPWHLAPRDVRARLGTFWHLEAK